MAISDAETVGVDIETIAPEWDWQSVAGIYLDTDRLVEASRGGQEAFLRFWTLHEAFSKASGSGITRCSPEDVSSERIFELAQSASRKGGAMILPGWKWASGRQRVASNDLITAVAVQSRS